MPVYAPGLRHGKRLKNTKRDVVAVLQLTAMVDMFTVLVVFLLQNYAVTDQILPVSEKIVLPKAEEVRELKPSHVVVLSEGQVILNMENLGTLSEHTSDRQWIFNPSSGAYDGTYQKSQRGKQQFFVSSIGPVDGR